MKKLLLRINHIIFRWYYKRVSDHFKQWTFFKSVKLLISNYEHQQLLYDIELRASSGFAKEATAERKKRFDLEMKLSATDSQIDWAKKNFGLDISRTDEN